MLKIRSNAIGICSRNCSLERMQYDYRASPDGGSWALVGRQGGMKPAGRKRMYMARVITGRPRMEQAPRYPKRFNPVLLLADLPKRERSS